VSDTARILVVNPGSIGQRVWLDLNGNDVFDDNEAGVSGLALELFLNGTRIKSGSTDEFGGFDFTSLMPGTYELRFAVPADRVVTMSPARSAALQATAVDGTMRFTIALSGGAVRLDANLGLRYPAVPPAPTTTTTTTTPPPTVPDPPQTTVAPQDPSAPTVTRPLPTLPSTQAPDGGGRLPATGSDAGRPVGVALAMLLAGLCLVVVATRRRRGVA
jgi:LPXTG-motif cell wall-anchored protein